MANLTSNSTFTHFVMGNIRGMKLDVSSAGQSTADLVVVPLAFVDGADFFGYRSGTTGLAPGITISGTTVNISNGTTGVPYTIMVYGH